MIGLIQRVSQASVTINEQPIGQINAGMLVLIGIEKSDTTTAADKLLHRLLGYRLFSDSEGKMNRSLQDTNGGLLLVPQFTLPADTSKGMRPSFTPAAAAEQGKPLFEYLLKRASSAYHTVASGQFGADMQVQLTNDGPVTFWLQTTSKS